MASALLAMSQDERKLALPIGSNCTEQSAGRRPPPPACAPAPRRAPGWRLGQHVEAREVGDQHQGHAEQHHRLAADPVGEPAEDHIADGADRRGRHHQHVDGRRRHLQELLHEGLGVEEGGVPDGPLGEHHAEQGEQHQLQVRHWPKASVKGALANLACRLHLANDGLSASFRRIKMETASRPAENRNGMRQPQASKRRRARRPAQHQPGDQDHRSAANRPKAAEVCTQLVGAAALRRPARARRHRSPRRRTRRPARSPG